MRPRRDNFSACGVTLLGAVSILVLLTSSAFATTVSLTQRSEPPGLFSEQFSQHESASVVATLQASYTNLGFTLTFWALDGVRQTDHVGWPDNPVAFTILNHVQALAHYVPTDQDANLNRIPDWYELRYFNSTNLPLSADVDGDGMGYGVEYEMGYSPIISNTVAGGGIAIRSKLIRAVLGSSFSQYTERSRPAGLISEISQVVSNGTVVSTRNLFSAVSGKSFAAWEINGVRATNQTGYALHQAYVTVSGATLAEAVYLPTRGDADADGLFDWFEVAAAGSTNVAPEADLDGDGLSLANEFRRHLTPGVYDQIVSGGIAGRTQRVRVRDPETPPPPPPPPEDPDDLDLDGLPDRWETNYFADLTFGPLDNPNGDAFTLREEFLRDFSPLVTNTLSPAGIAIRSYRLTAIIDTSQVWVVQTSAPEGVIARTGQAVSRGSMWTTPALAGATSDRHFTHWSVNGLRQTNTTGTAVGQVQQQISGTTTFTAHFTPTVQDQDSDGLSDWYELHYYGDLAGNAQSDIDGDGLTTADEIARHLHPRVFDAIHNHGVAIRLSAIVHADLQFFPRVRQVLQDGALEPFFSQDTATTGTFSIASNSHPAVGDWDGDGDLDLFVGGAGGQLKVFENDGSPVIMNLIDRTSAFGVGLWNGIGNPAPGLGDYNADGLHDLAVGGDTNTVHVWMSSGVFAAPGSAAFSIVVPGTGRVLPAFIGRDLLILKGDGLVSLYTNLPAGELSSTDYLGVAVPDARGVSVSDINEDNVPDVLISDQQGRIWEFHGQ